MATKTKKPAAKKATSKAAPKAKKADAAKPAADGKKLSQMDAAVAVLKKAGTPLNCKGMVEAMVAAKLWSSPNGKTPAATLYAAILREIAVKGKDARFKKVDRGQFALR